MKLFVTVSVFGTALLSLMCAMPSDASAQSVEELQLERSVTAETSTTSREGDALLRAVKAGDIHEARQLLDSGLNVNTANEAGITPLIVASAQNHHDLVVELLFAGANPHAISKFSWSSYVNANSERSRFHAGGVTALMIAASNGNLSVVETLLDSGVDVNQVNKLGTSALMLASFAGHSSVVDALLKNAALADLRSQLLSTVDDDGWQVAPGVARSLRNLLGHQAVDYAYWNGHGQVIVLLQEAADKGDGASVDELQEYLLRELWK